MITALLIFNTIVSLCVVGFVLDYFIFSHLEFSIERTFFCKIPFGINVTFWHSPKRTYHQDYEGNSGTGIFYWEWKDEDSIPDSPELAEQLKTKKS